MTHSQFAECLHIPFIVSRLVHRCFRNKGAMDEALVMEQAAKGIQSDHAFANVLMPVEL